MARGYFALVLHAHLPFVRHPEDPTVMEEQWLYEAITGTYLLKERYARHLDALIELAGKELERTRPEPHYHRLARMYSDRFQSLRHTWRSHDGDLVRAFRRLQDAGRVEVITS